MMLALATPYLPLAGLFGFVPLPGALLATIAVIVVVYVAATELQKKWVLSRHADECRPRERVRTS